MFYDIFHRLCDERGISDSTACLEMGFSRSYAAKMKNKNGAPSMDKLTAMAKYFGVSVDYLLTGEKEKAPGITAESLTDEEQELISIWRSVMSPEERTKQLAAWKARAGQQ